MGNINTLFKSYGSNKRDIPTLKRRLELLPYTRSLVGTQILSFTPVCHSNDSKTERQALQLLEDSKTLEAMIKDRECAVARVDDIIDSYKDNKPHIYNVLHLKVRKDKTFENIVEIIPCYYTVDAVKKCFYREVDRLEEENNSIQEDLEHRIYSNMDDE